MTELHVVFKDRDHMVKGNRFPSIYVRSDFGFTMKNRWYEDDKLRIFVVNESNLILIEDDIS